jgi:hypothetical protein
MSETTAYDRQRAPKIGRENRLRKAVVDAIAFASDHSIVTRHQQGIETMRNFTEFGPTKTRAEVRTLAKDAIAKCLCCPKTTILYRVAGDDGFLNVGETEGDWFSMVTFTNM